MFINILLACIAGVIIATILVNTILYKPFNNIVEFIERKWLQ